MQSEDSKQTDEQVSLQLIVGELQQLRADFQQLRNTANQQPRIDWKWFLSLALPLVTPFIAAGIIGYFGIKADLRGLQQSVQYMQTDITKTNQRLGDVEKRLRSVEQKQIETDGIQLL